MVRQVMPCHIWHPFHAALLECECAPHSLPFVVVGLVRTVILPPIAQQPDRGSSVLSWHRFNENDLIFLPHAVLRDLMVSSCPTLSH